MLRAPPLLSDQELLDVLSQIDQDSVLAADKSAVLQQAATAAAAESDVSAALAEGWCAVEMLEDSVFGSSHETNSSSSDEFRSFMDSLSHSDDTESVAGSPSVSSPQVPTANTQASGSASAAPSAKPSRKRRKHELDHLRSLASALETKLASIKKRDDDTRNATPGSSAQHFWKRISDQLLVDKQRAVGENARLREVLRDQIKVVKSLQRSLAKSPDLNKLGIFPVESAARTSPSVDSSKEIYGKMFRNISSSYDGMDSIFEQANMPRPSHEEARKVNMELRTENGVSRMCMQVVETRVIPFSFLFIGDAAWTHLTRKSDEERRMGLHREFYPDGDELYGECKLDCSTGVVKLAGHVAMRRYLEKNRLTFVWECVGTCQSDPYATKVVQMSEKGWCLFEPSEDDPLNSTVFRTCVHFTPTPVGEPQIISASPIDVGVTTELVLGVYEKTVGCICNAVLSSLLEGLHAAD